MAFIRQKEDFVCTHCGQSVTGDGYTNHCPHCLYSRHVDIEPGDRAAVCNGMMAPFDWEQQGKEIVIIHRCEKCGLIRRNRLQAGDNQEIILELSQRKSRE
ncbi:MAG: RNHCP domain-containing protein [Candidatus Komeilibacteria bacterium]